MLFRKVRELFRGNRSLLFAWPLSQASSQGSEQARRCEEQTYPEIFSQRFSAIIYQHGEVQRLSNVKRSYESVPHASRFTSSQSNSLGMAIATLPTDVLDIPYEHLAHGPWRHVPSGNRSGKALRLHQSPNPSTICPYKTSSQNPEIMYLPT